MTDIDTTLARFQLSQFRDSIDNLDAILVHTLAERFKLTQQVGKLKAQHNLPPADKAREAQQIERLRAMAQESGLDPAFAEKFLNFIVQRDRATDNKTIQVREFLDSNTLFQPVRDHFDDIGNSPIFHLDNTGFANAFLVTLSHQEDPFFKLKGVFGTIEQVREKFFI